MVAPLIGRLVQLAVSRSRESLADVSAVELTRNPVGLARALRTIADDAEVLEVANRATQHLYIVNPIKSFEERAKSMWDTHPPIAERIRALRGVGGPVWARTRRIAGHGRWLPLNGPCASSDRFRNVRARAAAASAAEVAQSVEHRPEEAGVVSSILTLGTIFAVSSGTTNGRKWLSW